ncbi:gamma-glutamylcyclotransferase [Streptomonospora wellingtoniae]|uniref:Gamma-glutamylcyclotransferase n=1 Tax=Streptomonospora wellingtoniae TaxID=3075544 RepID=A0ABU2KZ70_9ACTN|nr:gamma-glutamylcyclotransferase [Streptomonospora sp. DSM 45055]MDT0304596.1 gamma-glutamylcyclotransferase [Streptomonospora sp. DSM 45055]
MALYAAYGCNLDPDQMAVRARRSPLWTTGWLDGWRLTFGGASGPWGGALATIAEQSGASVFVALYDVPECDEAHVDACAGAGFGIYTRVRVRASTLLEGEAAAWTHVLDDYEGGLPSALYLSMLADAAEKAGAPPFYPEELRSRPCAPSRS